jgi:superfamily II DNA or RNA helicase
VRIPITLTSRSLYDRLRKEAVVEVNSMLGESRQVVAKTVLTLLLRLQQATSGFIRPADDGPTETVSTEKLDTTKELVADALAQRRKVVVFVRFLHDMESLRGAFGPSVRVGTLVGGQTSTARKAVVDDFRAGKYDVIVAQIRVASLGIDLSTASVGIFYSLTFSLDEFLQAKARLLGRHQTHDVTYYHLIATDTVDDKIYKALTAKIDIGSRLTELQYTLDLLG